MKENHIQLTNGYSEKLRNKCFPVVVCLIDKIYTPLNCKNKKPQSGLQKCKTIKVNNHAYKHTKVKILKQIKIVIAITLFSPLFSLKVEPLSTILYGFVHYFKAACQQFFCHVPKLT